MAARVGAAGWDVCFAVGSGRVLFGRLDADQLAAEPSKRVAEVMKAGPTTYRPDMSAADLFHRMSERGITTLPVTTSEGRLIGAVLRDDLARAHGAGAPREDGSEEEDAEDIGRGLARC